MKRNWCIPMIMCAVSVLLAVSLMGCGKEAPRPAVTPMAPKGVLEAALDGLKSDSDFRRREAVMVLTSPPTRDARIVPALKEALKKEKVPALQTAIRNAIQKAR